MTVFGLQWTQATDVYTRATGGGETNALTNLAVTSPTNAATLAAVAQASTYAPWSGMRRCNLWDDGTPTAYYGDRCYTDTDVANMGQAMVRIPKFWYTTNHGGGVYIWYISDTGADALPTGADHAWAVHPAFIRNGITKNNIYLGAYGGYLNGTKLESKSGVTPTNTPYQLSNFRGWAEALGAGWELFDFLTLSAVQLLYLIEYGTFHIPLVIGNGITLDAAVHITGETSAYGNATYGTAANQTTAMSYRGIENLLGNLSTFIDGININSYVPAIADHGFADDTYTGTYTSTGLTTVTATGGKFDDLLVDATYDYVFMPKTTGAAGAVHLCALVWSATGARGLLCGGAYASQWYPSFFAWMAAGAETVVGTDKGSRLEYIG